MIVALWLIGTGLWAYVGIMVWVEITRHRTRDQLDELMEIRRDANKELNGIGVVLGGIFDLLTGE